jgi:4-hydroxybenzoate polyprenyltransferase
MIEFMSACWSTAMPIGALVLAMRPHQWLKNLACLAGVIFSGQLFDTVMLLRAGLAVVAFSLAASAVYLLNDIIDRDRDRRNPRTAARPIASGRLTIAVAVAAFIVLLIIGLIIAADLGTPCLVILMSYHMLNIAYSLRLKRTVIADVICIALGFVLRVLMGVYAVQVLPSPWIVLCMFFLALFLGFGKRRAELGDLADSAGQARPVLEKYAVVYLDFAIGLTATLTVTSYSLYCVAPHHDPTMAVTILPVVYCVLRYALQVIILGHGQSPERLLLRDEMLWIGILVWVVLSVCILYGKPGLFTLPKRESAMITINELRTM